MNTAGLLRTLLGKGRTRLSVSATADNGSLPGSGGGLIRGHKEANKMEKALSVFEECDRARVAEKQQYRRVYCVIFFVFFWVSFWSRLLPSSLRPFASTSRGGESIWQEARRATHTVMGFAFMG